MLESVVSARGKVLRTNFSATSRVTRATKRCLRCLLLVMCTHPIAKEVLTLHLARSEGHERYFGCNLMYRKVLVSSHQHLMAEAPRFVSSS